MSSSNRMTRAALRRTRAAAAKHPVMALGAAGTVFLALPPGMVETVTSSPLPLAVGTTAAAGGLVVAGVRYWTGTRWSAQSDNGFAPRHQLDRSMGPRQMRSRKRRKELRPSLAHLPRRKVSPTDLGFYTGTSVHNGVDTYIKIGDPMLVVAPPGTGKTAYLARSILTAQGAVVATSTKLEPVFDDIAEIRARDKGPVLWFNPEGLGGRESTLIWDPVIGCSDPSTAIRRAGFLLSGSQATAGTEHRGFWSGSNFDILKSLLWAADMANLSLLDVARWSKNAADREPIEIMERFGFTVPPGWREDLVQAQENPKDKTTVSVYKTLALTFSFLADPSIAATVTGARTAVGFDADLFIASSGTLFMLGEDREFAGVGPLFTALTGELYHVGGQLAAANEVNRRLDPPLTMVLDEAALICSVPLERWTSDARGKGISIHLAMQTMSQAIARWGRHPAETIWTNCTRLVLGGLAVPEQLQAISQMCGERTETFTTSTSSGETVSVSTGTRRVPVMSSADITGLEPGTMLMLRRQQKPVLVTYRPVWELPALVELYEARAKAKAKARWKARRERLRQLRQRLAPGRGNLVTTVYGPPEATEAAGSWGPGWSEPAAEGSSSGWWMEESVYEPANGPVALVEAPQAPPAHPDAVWASMPLQKASVVLSRRPDAVPPPVPVDPPTIHLQPPVGPVPPAAKASLAAEKPQVEDPWDDEEAI
ncbi:type IV secretory system conjugative DNA transfer family protein [Kitasatospora griseola]|uniref:type IV secretory system conjugative DNA transfer family protein n=1 Tax=Kitasatospora griseola TaxID=2064 RepID=UPI003647B0F2